MSRRNLWIIGIAALAVGIIVWDSLFTVHQTQQAESSRIVPYLPLPKLKKRQETAQ